MRSRFQAALEERIQNEIDRVATSVVTVAVKDYAEYRQWTGYVAGLQAVLAISHQIETEMSDERDRAA